MSAREPKWLKSRGSRRNRLESDSKDGPGAARALRFSGTERSGFHDRERDPPDLPRTSIRAGLLASELERGCQTPVKRVATFDDRGVAGEVDRFALVLFCLDHRVDWDALAEVLRRCSTSRTPVVAVSGRYDEAQALTCFRMGVTDYLSLSDHRDVIPAVDGTMIAERGAEVQDRRVRGGKTSRSRPALNH